MATILEELQLHDIQIEGMREALYLLAFAMMESKSANRELLNILFDGKTEQIKNDPKRGTKSRRDYVCLWMNAMLPRPDETYDDAQERSSSLRASLKVVQGGKADDAQPEHDGHAEKKE
jgi:hypothetical protein